MFTEEQILELYFKRDEHAVEMTSQMYGAKLTRFADSMVAHEDAVECVNDTYILDSRINMTRLEPPLRVLHIFQLAC